MYTTNNYSVLKNLDGGEDKTIYPNKPFGAFQGNYQALSTLQIYKDGSFSFEIPAGAKISGIGEIEEAKMKPKAKGAKKAAPKKEVVTEAVIAKPTEQPDLLSPGEING